MATVRTWKQLYTEEEVMEKAYYWITVLAAEIFREAPTLRRTGNKCWT